MNTQHDDMLTENDLYKITGVPSTAREKARKRAQVLKEAGIHCWFVFEKKDIVTTWHHVHAAGTSAGARYEDDRSMEGVR